MTVDPIDRTPANPPAYDLTINKQVDQEKYKKIRGWLIFLIVSLMLLTPSVGSRLLFQTNEARRVLVSRVSAPETLDTTLNIYKVSIQILMGLGFISGLLLLLRLRIGVTTTKLFFIANVTAALVVPVMMLLVDSQERINQLLFKEGLTDIPARLIVSAAWYAYLVKSKRVAAVYGLEN